MSNQTPWSTINKALNAEERDQVNRVLFELNTIRFGLNGWTQGKTHPITGKATPERELAEQLDRLMQQLPNHLKG